MDQQLFHEFTWEVIDKYFRYNKGYQLIKHQTESFNDFLLNKLEQIIEGFNPIEIHHQYIPEEDKFKYILTIELKNPVLAKPTISEKDGSVKIMTPNDARQRNFTYSSNLTVDMYINTKTIGTDGEYISDSKRINNISLGKVPIMVKSNYCVIKNKYINNGSECRYDFGGYFIVNGNEKVVISQDRISENKTYVFMNNKVSTYSHVAEIRSVQENKLGVPKITSLKLSAKANQFGRYIRANVHHIKTDIPVFILFKALGLKSDKEILMYILYDLDSPVNALMCNELTGCIEDGNYVSCQRDAFEYLSKYLNITGYPKEFMTNKIKRINIIRHVLEKEFLPHVGHSFEKKALYLGFMVNKLMKCFLGLKEYDDRDSYINKRIDTPGILMANLFRQYYGKVIKDMKNMIQKEINNGGWKATNKFINVINKVNVNNKIIKSAIIDSGLRYALATGNWGIKNNKNKQGVAQVLNRMTYNSTISHLRRVNTPIEKSGKLVQPRKLHPTQWGTICPAECFDPETPILMWSGIIKKAKDIIVGDYLIDDKGNSVRVKSTCSGEKAMYEVVPKKVNFMSHTVTDNHILTLKVRNHTRNPTKYTKKYKFRWFNKDTLKYAVESFDTEEDLEKFKASVDDVIDITIEQYLTLPENVQKELYIFKCDGVNWEYKEVALDPYILGMWLGDGFSCGFGFATADKELLDKWIEWGKDNDATIKKGIKYKYGISSTINNTQPGISCNKTERAPLKTLLAKYNLVKNKHIPLDYLVNDRKTRLAVLAGLIDTDGNVRANGHEVRICQGEDNYKIIHDIEFLARSLGFSCYMNDGTSTYTVKGEKRKTPYKELTITGQYLYEIPTVLPRKKLNEFDNPTSIKKCSSYLQSPFELVKKDIQPFVGWQLEGNGRFMLGDMIISHNTPEGSSVGLVKNLSLISGITIASNSTNVRELIIKLGTIEFTHENIHVFHNNTRLIINGDIVGIHKDPIKLFNDLKDLKRQGVINIFTGIIWNILENEIAISTEGGRAIRPLYIVGPNNTFDVLQNEKTLSEIVKKDTNWQDMLVKNNNIIEFLDVEEVNASMIAMKYIDLFKGMKGNSYQPNYTHLELHPSLILGALASCIPFSDHNQAPRNCYQASQGKQALGIYTSNFRDRYDTLAHVMNYPQKPIVRTKMSKYLNNDTLPCGINAIVAIATYTGYNQEDSIIMNKSAIDRGLFTSTYYRTYKEQNNKNHSNGEEEFFTKPTETSNKPYSYDKLNDDGFIPENEYVNNNDIIIGKCMPNKVGNTIVHKDNSVPIKNNETGFIDRNCYNEKYFPNVNGDGYNFCKVRIRSERVPTVGDKFSSRCYDKETEILTDKGWKFFKDLTLEDKVASFVDKNKLIYQNPIELQRFPYKGKMYRVKSNQVDLLVTPNHRMWVAPRVYTAGAEKKYRVELAEDLHHKSRHYKKNCDEWVPDFSGNFPRELIVENNQAVKFIIDNDNGMLEFDIEDWIAFYGIWIAEGCCSGTGPVNFAAHKQRVKDKLNEICLKMRLDISKKKYYPDDKIENSYNFHEPALRKHFKTLSVGAINKSLCEWVWYLDMKQAKLLVDSMCLGDGGEMANGTWRYYTASTKLADDFQRLCLHAGVSCNKKLKSKAGTVGGKSKTGMDIISRADYWVLTIIESQNEPLVNKNLKKDHSNALDCWEDYDDDVFCCTVPNGEGVVYVRRCGCPVFGGNSAQKGTVGLTYTQEDMPYTKDGIVPDLIMNPHAIPSRMTMGQLLECIMGKSCVMMGTYGDATPFNEISIESIADILESYGMERYGNEILYDSRTGKQIPTSIFIGPTFYQRLKHMTNDKIHCYSYDTEVLTSTGWILFSKLTKKHKVASLVYGAIKYQYPAEIQEYDYKGEMFCVETDDINILVTPNHKMYIREEESSYTLQRADAIFETSVYWKKNIDTFAPRFSNRAPETLVYDSYTKIIRFQIANMSYNINSWLIFFGIWITKGEVNKDTYIVSIDATEVKVQRLLIQIEEEFGVKQGDWDIHNETLGSYMLTYSVGWNYRYLPSWVWYLNRDQCRILIESMCFMCLDDNIYTTSSSVLADDFQRLCLHACWSCDKTETERDNKTSWHLVVNMNNNEPRVDKDKYQWIKDYDNKIYCCTVPKGEGVIYVRRRGIPCWCGNSRSSSGPIIILTRQPAEGRAREGGLRIGEMECGAIQSNGMALMLKERLMECSDNYRIFVCKNCGLMATVNPEKNIYFCKNCKNNNNFAQCRIPYAYKLLLQEIQTMGISTKFLMNGS